jgi:hypothetical protein
MADKQKLDWPLCNVDAIALCRLENVVAWLEHVNVEYHMIDGLIADLHSHGNFLSEEDYQTLDNLTELAGRIYRDIIDLRQEVRDASN